MSPPITKSTLHVHSLGRVLAVVGIVALANLLLMSVSLRADLTSGRQYTLGRSTRDLIRNLPQVATIKLYLSQEFPENLLGLRQDLRDLVGEYARASRGQVVVEERDPKTDPAAAAEAERYGVPQIQFNNFGAQKLSISTGYAGLAILYGGKAETIRVVQEITNLEYDLTAAIQKLSRAKALVLGVANGYGMELPEVLRGVLARQYAVQDVYLNDPAGVPAEVDALLLLGPTEAIADYARYNLDQYVMSNRPLLVFADGFSVQPEYLTGDPNPALASLNELLGAWGVRIAADVVGDALSNEVLQFQSGFLRVLQPYPLWAKAIPPGIAADHPITAKLRSLTLPWASSLQLSATGTGRTVTTLVRTSPRSFSLRSERGSLFLSPQALQQAAPDVVGSQPIVVIVQGTLPTAFANKPIPAEILKSLDRAPRSQVGQTTAGNVLVAGSSRMLQPEIIQQAPENFALLANALDGMLQGNSLADIRTRGLANRPIAPLEDYQKSLIRYGNLGAGVLFALLTGGIALLIRRRADRRAQAAYG